jgi:hypothetical protein
LVSGLRSLRPVPEALGSWGWRPDHGHDGEMALTVGISRCPNEGDSDDTK